MRPAPLNNAAKLPINTKSAVPMTYTKLSDASTVLAKAAYEPITIKIPKPANVIVYVENQPYLINNSNHYLIQITQNIPYRIKITGYRPNGDLVLFYDKDYNGSLDKLVNTDALGYWWLYSNQSIGSVGFYDLFGENIVSIPKGYFELNGTASEIIIYANADDIGYPGIIEGSYEPYIFSADVDGNTYPEFVFITEDQDYTIEESFLRIFDQSAKTIMTGGQRRSAHIALLDISHPEIEDFITVKQGDANKELTQFNISVKITDAFIEAVEKDRDWNLVFEGKIYKTVKARNLYDLLARNAYIHNEPGIFNADTIERYKPGLHHELYTHALDAPAGGNSFTGFVGGGNFFAGQGLSLDSWGDLSGIGQHRNEKVSAVVAALAGFLGDDRLGIGTDIHLSFNAYGATYCSQVPLPGSLWFLFSGLGVLGVARRGWWRK